MNIDESKKNKNKKEHIISKVEENSIAQELELEPKDVLISINGQEIRDVFDYRYLINDEEITLLVRKANGQEWELEIEKEYNEDLGIHFESGLMDEYRSCTNNCVFCFIDQMPPGMRETLYFKDDDSRLSFLQGNYITLTNMKDNDIDRIIQYRLEPINISVHTLNPTLRCEMLHNRFAGEAIAKIQRLRDAGIEMNGQIVLCKGINDQQELEDTLDKLLDYQPAMKSVSIVPVGLTKYRDNLHKLEPFTKEDAINVIETIERIQKKSLSKYQTHFVHGGDEWYLLAECDFPTEDSYDGYLQLENGVGMMRLLKEEFLKALDKEKKVEVNRKITIATGKLAAPMISELSALAMDAFTNLSIEVIPITNHFFGEKITVSGLLTGQDILEQLKDLNLGDGLLLPANLLRSKEEVFLDDITLSQVKTTLQVPIYIVKSSGHALLCNMLGKDTLDHTAQKEITNE